MLLTGAAPIFACEAAPQVFAMDSWLDAELTQVVKCANSITRVVGGPTLCIGRSTATCTISMTWQ